MWWDSRNDPCYSPTRPIGNCANGTLVPSLDVYGTTLDSTTLAPAAITRITDVTSNPNWDQFGGRTVPFAGDYLWIDSAAGRTFSTWTDYRNTRARQRPPNHRNSRRRPAMPHTACRTAHSPVTPARGPADSIKTSTATCRPSAQSRHRCRPRVTQI